MNIAIYSRKSCVTDKGESIQNQINICQDYVFNHIDKAKNFNLIIYKDEGFSAKNTDRPEFKKMIKDAEKKKFSHIVCYRLDRISRNVGDFSKLIEELSRINISLVCVKEQFDTSVPMGRAMMYIASVFAQLERETIAERVKDNMMMLSKHGQWLGGTTPLGFKSYKMAKNSSDVNSKYKFYLKENKKELQIAEKIFYKFLSCKSLSETKKYLDSIGTTSRKGNKFSIPAIKKILGNPVYCRADKDAEIYFKKLGGEVCFSFEVFNSSRGIIAYNKRNYRENSGKENPVQNWIIARGSHKGLINGKHWVEINKILNARIYKNKTSDSLLSQKIICKTCGAKMLIKRRKDHENFDYICANKIYNSAKKCSCRNLNGRYIDNLVAYKIITTGLKNNCFFIKKINSLKSSLSTGTKFGECKTFEFDSNIYTITENICKNISPYFVNRIIKRIFWDNVSLDIKLKNCD